MRNSAFFILSVLFCADFSVTTGYAQSADELAMLAELGIKPSDLKAFDASDEALKNTQALMRDPALRKAVLESDAKSKELDQKINQLTSGSAVLNQGVYGISADVLEKLVSDSSGDPIKMKALLDQAQKDPETFYKKLSPELQNKVRGLAGQIEIQKAASKK